MDMVRMGLLLFVLMVMVIVEGGCGYVLDIVEGGKVVEGGVKKLSNETCVSDMGRLGGHHVLEGIRVEKKLSKKRCLSQGRRDKKSRGANSLVVGISRLKKLNEIRSTLPIIRRGGEKSSRELISERSTLSVGSDEVNSSGKMSERTTLTLLGSDMGKSSGKLSERSTLSIIGGVENRGNESRKKLTERSALAMGSDVEKSRRKLIFRERSTGSGEEKSERSSLFVGNGVGNVKSTLTIESGVGNRGTLSLGRGVENSSERSTQGHGRGVDNISERSTLSMDEEEEVGGSQYAGSSVFVEEEKKKKVTYEATVYPGEGQFLTVLKIGTPPVSFSAIVDTGSDLVWRQCKPCKLCYPQKQNMSLFPIFDPALSSTYSKAPCTDPLCIELGSYGGSCHHRTCHYTSPYDDPPAYTRGDLSFDSLSISDLSGHLLSLPRFAFGCSHESRGPYNFAGSGGIVGLGQGKLSLPAQLGVKKFSYCLRRFTVWRIPSLLQDNVSFPSPFLQRSDEVSSSPPPSLQLQRSADISTEVISSSVISSPAPSSRSRPKLPSHGSPLLLGDDATIGDGAGIQSTRILASEDAEDTAYNVELRGISVGGRRLNISRGVFRRGGTIIDSGTTFTTLATQAFHAVYSAFRARIPLKPAAATAATPRNLSLCYASLPSPIPSLAFHFRGANLHLPAHNYFVFIDNLFCLAILQSHDSRSVYGNVQQQDFHILYDLHSRLISFKPTSCSLYHR